MEGFPKVFINESGGYDAGFLNGFPLSSPTDQHFHGFPKGISDQFASWEIRRDLLDNSGNSRDLSVAAGTFIFSENRFRMGVFNGVNTVLRGSQFSLNPSSNLSFSVWTKAITGGCMIDIASGNTPGSSIHDRSVFITSTGSPGFYTFPGSAVTTINRELNLLDNKIHHITGSIGSNGQFLYVDGVLRSFSENKSAFQGYTNHGIILGRVINIPNLTVPSFFQGEISDVKIFNRQLSGLEVSLLYNNGLCSGLFY